MKDPKLEKVLLLLRETILSYTKHGDRLETTGASLSTSIAFTVQAHRDDHSKIVGAKGQHIWALQTIFDFIGRSIGTRVRVTLLEPAFGEKLPLTPYQADPKWKPEKVLGLIRRILDLVLVAHYELKAEGESQTTIEIKPTMIDRPRLLRMDNSEKNDFGEALHYIFHAIGKSQGRIIYIDVVDPMKKEVASA
jgi:predicted RNA-binding protein YlqC (UPF0109 family)